MASDNITPGIAVPEFLSGGGEMGELIRSKDWSKTPLGSPDTWPQSLRTTVSLCLASNFPISIAWGEHRVQIYNDGYWPITGDMHPTSMGQDFKECWLSAWPVIGQAFEEASLGQTRFLENQRIFVDRYGYKEETFFTFSFSPILDESGGVGGLFHPVIEMTQQTLAERRLNILRAVADNTVNAKTAEEASALILECLKDFELDLPFVLLYSIAANGKEANLEGSVGVERDSPLAPVKINLEVQQSNSWPFTEVIKKAAAVQVEELSNTFGAFQCGPYPEPPKQALIFPVTLHGTAQNNYFLVAGVSSRRNLDEKYQLFYELLSASVTNALTKARAYDEERKKAEALAEIDKAKTVFFSNISHEFRTPLTLMLGSLEELLNKPTGEIAVSEKEAIETSHRNAMRLLRLVNNLLDFSRIEAGRVQAQYQLTDLAKYTTELASNFRSVVEAAGLIYQVKTDAVIQPVYIDKEMWEKIVLNLLSNAFKYTLKGSITVTLDTAPLSSSAGEGLGVRLKVADTGVGIPEAELPKMFQRFHRVQNVVGRTYEGTGIGLSLVSELVKLHGGEIKVESKEAEGSVFTVSIPTGKAHLSTEHVFEKGLDPMAIGFTASLSGAFIEEATTLIDDNVFTGNGTEALEVHTDVATVLVVDDNADMRAYIKNLLQKQYRVVTASNGMEALHQIKNHSPQLILSDIMMPVMDGIGLMKTVKDNVETQNIPVILLSARAGEEAKIEGYETGADDYLVKPFSAKELLARVASQIKTSNTRKHIQQQLQSIMTQAPVAMCVLRGPTYIVEVANERMLELWGKTSEQMMNKPVFEAMPDVAGQGFEDLLNNVCKTGIPFIANELPIDLIRKGKPERAFLNFVYKPLYDADEKISGIVAVATEITEQVIASKKIEESEHKFRIAIEGGGLGTYDFYPQTGELFWSEKTKEFFGLLPEAEVDYSIFLKGLHPDDRERSDDAIQKAMKPNSGGRYENEYRTVGITDGKLRWIKSQGKVNFDVDGRPIRFTGVTQEITRQKELIRSLQLQSLVLESMDEGVSVSDENGNILLTNAAEDKMFGYEAGELIGKHVTLQNAYAPEENERIVSNVITELKLKGFWSGEWHNRKKDGTLFYTFSFITQLQIDNAPLFVCVQRDVTEEKLAKEILAYRTALLEAQNEAIPDAILIVDTKGKMLSFNQHFVVLWNIPKDIIDRKDDTAALQFAMAQLVDPQGFIDRVNYCYAHPNERAHEEVLFKDGRIIERYGNVVNGEDGTNYGWAWYFRDITETKKIEEDLKNAKEQLELTFKNISAGIYLFNNKGELIYVNDKGAKVYGDFNAADLLEEKDLHALLKKADELFERYDENGNHFAPQNSPAYIGLTTGLSAQVVLKQINKTTKEESWHYVQGAPLFDDEGKVSMVLVTSTDITVQKLTEEKVRQSEERFRSLANSLPQLAWMTDAEGWIYWYNQRWYDYTGTTLEEMQGWGWQSVHHPDFVEGVKRDFTNAIAKGEPYDDTFMLRSKEGEYRWFLTRAVPIRNGDGQVVQWFGTNTDVSAQKEVEDALKAAKDQLELTFQNVPSAIYHFDKTGNILYLNEKGAHQMGYATVEDVLAEKNVFNFRKKLDEIFTVLDEKGNVLPADQSSAALTFKTGKSSEVVAQFINKTTGSSFWLLSKSAPLYDEKGELSIVLTTATDISHQKISEQAIRQSEENFRQLADLVPQIIWTSKPDGFLDYYNNRWYDYTGFEEGYGDQSWIPILHPDDVEFCIATWHASVKTGEPYHIEYRFKDRTSGIYRWFLGKAVPIRDGSGTITKWFGTCTDIHDQKTITENLEKLVSERTKELERSNEDLQQFAHVASHDLKEPVRKIMTFGNRLKDEFEGDLPEKAKNYIAKIEGASKRMYSMIDGVLLYSSVGSGEQSMEKVDLNETMRYVETDLELVIQQKQAVIHKEHLPVIEGSPVLLHQLFYNLVNNALKFSKADVKPLIQIGSEKVKGQNRANDGRPVQEYLQISVRDNGIGFDQRQADAIFKSFSRLNSRDKYEGTGLGLALCKKIAERHRGTMIAEGAEGEGATFTIVLPVKES